LSNSNCQIHTAKILKFLRCEFGDSLLKNIVAKNGLTSGFLAVFGVIATLTFDPLTLISNQFIFAQRCEFGEISPSGL